MLEPINIENENLLIHSFRAEEIKRITALARDVYGILSDGYTLKFIPEKRLHSLEESEAFLKSNLLRFHSGKSYLHFITDKSSGEVIGLIDVIAPETARKYYKVDHYPHFVEFYLKAEFGRKKIMTRLLPLFIKKLHKQRITDIGAVANRNNIGAQKVLANAGFRYQSRFDILQDFYVINTDGFLSTTQKKDK